MAALVDSAPETLDTLKEVATAIQENETVVEALNSAIGNKANAADVVSLTGDQIIHGSKSFTGNIVFESSNTLTMLYGGAVAEYRADGIAVNQAYWLKFPYDYETEVNQTIATREWVGSQSPKLYRHDLTFNTFSFSIYTRDSNAYTDVSEFKDKLPAVLPVAYYDDTYAGGATLLTESVYGTSNEIDARLTGVVNVWAGDGDALLINQELTLANEFWDDAVTEI